jgi:hypothetical protein
MTLWLISFIASLLLMVVVVKFLVSIASRVWISYNKIKERHICAKIPLAKKNSILLFFA